MPKLKPRARRNSGLMQNQRDALLHGYADIYMYEPDEVFPNEKAIAESWAAHRDRLLRIWVFKEGADPETNPLDIHLGGPGTRPWAWWQNDALEMLRIVNVEYITRTGIEVDREPTKADLRGITKRCSGNHFGTYGQQRGAGILDYETEAEYLRRHKLFLPGEEALVTET